MTRPRLSLWQRQVLADLDAISVAFPGDVTLLGQYRLDKNGSLQLRLRIRTADIPHVNGGLPIGSNEEVTVTVGRFDVVPPLVEVDHLRFLHCPHVLLGRRLCLYLDPSREWDPVNGFRGFLDRLFGWFGDAAAGRFDAQAALYHAVGGVIHDSVEAPTIVVREGLRAERCAQHGWLVYRTEHRLDLSLDRPLNVESADHVPVITLNADLPFGAGIDLQTFLQIVEDPYLGRQSPGAAYWRAPPVTAMSATVLTVIGASAIRKPDGSPQRFVVAVPHPTGGPLHLMAANIPARGADHIRALVRSSGTRRSMIQIDRERVDAATPLEWWPMSDERQEVTTRRDAARPVAGYEGKTVHVWGCGGLGSWVAEYVVRAGVKKIVLCDPSTITGGLLVRQNFVEEDVGNTKVQALAQRLRAISDKVEVETHDGAIAPADEDGTELIIDTTVSVAIGRFLDHIARTAGSRRPLLAQMTTDARTGTMGILTVSAPPLRSGPLAIDRKSGEQVTKDSSLEAFHRLWDPAEDEDQIIPTRGCSTPTFHGSAADLAGVAASLTSILGAHLGLGDTVSGTHLISLPHGEAGPMRAFFPAATSVEAQSDSVGVA